MELRVLGPIPTRELAKRLRSKFELAIESIIINNHYVSLDERLDNAREEADLERLRHNFQIKSNLAI